jgi:hypothetical protein
VNLRPPLTIVSLEDIELSRREGFGAAPEDAPIALMCESLAMPTDDQIEIQIDLLETERESLREREGNADPTLERDASRLEEIRIDLERLWDLLRQRRALREADQDPDLASERSAETVEKYWQ